MEEKVAIRSRLGSLEGVFGYDGRSTAGRGVLLLPPHPSFGGDLENNVIAGAATAFAESGLSSLRFNYHGVGRSEGGPDDPLERVRYWSKLLERDGADDALADAAHALDWLLSFCGEVHAFGYSYGAFLALRLAAIRDEVRSVAVIGLATAHHDMSFLSGVGAPVLAIHGDRDFATPTQAVDAVLAAIPASSRCVVLEGGDHFFRGREREVAGFARDFFDDPTRRFEPGGAPQSARRTEAGDR